MPFFFDKTIMSSQNPHITLIQTEAANLRALNKTLEITINSLSQISNNLDVLAANMSNSNKLRKIYTDIHAHNRRLSELMDSDVKEDIGGHIDVLNRRIQELNNQLNAMS